MNTYLAVILEILIASIIWVLFFQTNWVIGQVKKAVLWYSDKQVKITEKSTK